MSHKFFVIAAAACSIETIEFKPGDVVAVQHKPQVLHPDGSRTPGTYDVVFEHKEAGRINPSHIDARLEHDLFVLGDESDALRLARGPSPRVKAVRAASGEGGAGGDGEDGLEAMTINELRDLADEHSIALGEARKKADIIAVIRAAPSGEGGAGGG